MLGRNFILPSRMPELKRFHVVCPCMTPCNKQRRRHTMTQHKVWKSYIGLWVTLTNCASEWMESLTSPQGCGPPACLHSFGLLEHWLESRRPSAVIIFPHRNSGRHHYHGTTVCGLMASHFHSPCHVVAIEGGLLVLDQFADLQLFPKFSRVPSHRIIGYMHGVLNVVEKNNSLYSLTVNDETNLLSLITL